MTTQQDAKAWGPLIRRGIGGGLVGGIVLAMIMMIVAAAMGKGFLAPLYVVAATFHHAWAMTTGVDGLPLVIGLMFHMVNSALYGMIFAALVGAATPRGALVLGVGMAYGIIVLVVNQAVILPIVDPAMATATSGMMLWWVIGHVMYGLILGVTIAYRGGVAAKLPQATLAP